MTPGCKVLIVRMGAGDAYRAGRTRCALKSVRDACEEVSLPELPTALGRAGGSVWIVRAGAWPVSPVSDTLRLPPTSGTGRPLCALGALHPPDSTGPESGWRTFLAGSGGHLDEHLEALPRIMSVFLEEPLALALAETRGPLDETLRSVLRSARARVVRWQGMDVAWDARLRVAEVITSLQRGGAERVVLDLAATLPACGVRPRVIVTGRTTRRTYPPPEDMVDVSGRGERSARMAAAARAAAEWHADLVHAHLLTPADLEPFRMADLPVLLTMHNARPGWPLNTERLCREADLIVACAQRVEQEVRAAGIPIPVRTAWNGVADYSETTPRAALRTEVRNAHGIPPGDVVLLALANPRRQKRLERLPAVLNRVQAQLDGRGAWLMIAGEATPESPDAREAEGALSAAIAMSGVAERVIRVGSVEDVTPVLAAADVVVSASAWEGLSLALLEGVAAGVPVVATDTGGTAEIESAAIRLLGVDFDDSTFAKAVIDAVDAPSPIVLPADFRRQAMAERYAQLMPRTIAVARRQPAGRGLWLVGNNFSTGGAQSSARRLLEELQRRGFPVRACVVQEQPDFPTPGRVALEAAGVRVLALPKVGTVPVSAAAAQLLEAIDADPPAAVVLWNLIASYKVLLTDLLLDVPVWDVSPGEMNFAALEKYFTEPRAGMPYRTARAYGARLAGAVVKFAGERAYAETFFGRPVAVVPNGVLVPEQCPPPRPPDGRLVIGTVARLSPQKKLEDLLAAVRRVQGELKPYALRVAGGADGGDEAYVQQLKAAAQGLCVEWLGPVSDVTAFLRELDVFAMISEPAGCPNASLEAMAAGRTVIATDFGGAREQVSDGVTGRLTPRGDAAALGRALVEACAAEKRAAWGYAGWERARESFSIQRMAEDYVRVLGLR